MLYVDRVIRQHQVLHRANAAQLCSRATLMRRVRSGEWWRPTARTVAVRTENPDAAFDLLVAAAHVWPAGGLAGPTLVRLTHPDAGAGEPVFASVPAPQHLPSTDRLIVQRRVDVCLVEWQLPSRRTVPVDIGNSSLRHALTPLDSADQAWLLINAFGSHHSQPQHARDRVDEFRCYLVASDVPHRSRLAAIVDAVAAGCESAGEVYVWHILTSLGLRFTTQHVTRVPSDRREQIGTATIRSDFLIDDYNVIIEVDSRLHDHVADVRRDLWSLERGTQTLRIVGTDVIADPAGARRQLIIALDRLGVATRPRALPSWLTPPRQQAA